MFFLTARWRIGTLHSLPASVCVFSDRTMAHPHFAFVAGQRVCFFLTARWRIRTLHSLPASVCVFSDRTMAHPQLKVMALSVYSVGRRQAVKSWSGGRHRVQRGGAAL